MEHIEYTNTEILDKVNDVLRIDEYKRFTLAYILKVKDESENCYAVAIDGDEIIGFNPFEKEIDNIPDWDFNMDRYLFEELEWNREIIYMSADCHYGVWNEVSNYYPEDIEHMEGMQMYLRYCADNAITKEFIDKKTELDTPNIMEYLDDLEIGAVYKYKDYFVAVYDYNPDTESEKIVDIYKSKQDYIDGVIFKSVSVSKYGLKQNINDYIEANYIQPKIQVQQENDEKTYLSFVIHCDSLQDILRSCDTPKCDVNYNFCKYLTGEFLKSEDYKDVNHSVYETLEKWIIENKARIQYEYNEYTGKKHKTYNEKTLLLQGDRNGQPIALVKRNIGGRVEYVIAFNHEIRNNDLTWGYGYYYSNDFNKAIQDYQKVILGGNLADTFKDKKPETIKKHNKNKDMER